MSQSFELGSDGIYRCMAFQQFSWQEHGFGTRFSNPPVQITLRQIHSNVVMNAHDIQDRAYEGDALVTNEIDRTIGVRTADCVPILLIDPRHKAVAAVHAGWRGTAAEIVSCTLQKLSDEFRTQPADVYAAIGPCIRGCCYEVGPEVAARFVAAFPEWPSVTGKRNVDLAEANVRQLIQAGVPSEQVYDAKLCTACRLDDFFSFRREPENPGRLISAITRVA